MKYIPASQNLFIESRRRFTSRLPQGAMAVFHSNDEFPRSGDSGFDFRQNSDLLYLSGIDQEQTILLLFPESPNPRYREILFIRETNEHIAVWEGNKLDKTEASALSGIHTEYIHWIEDFAAILAVCMNYAEMLYLNSNENDRYNGLVPYRDHRFAREMQEKYPLHQFRRSAPILRDLRVIKSSEEIGLVKSAIEITSKAFRRILENLRPGVMEYELEAEIIHEFIRSRATGHAYHPIIASGASSCILHYNENNRKCRAGDILLLDFGAEYANYNADLSRSIPVSGRFSERQRQVYDAVLRIFKFAKTLLAPGMLLEDYRQETDRFAESEIRALGLLKETGALKGANNSQFRKYYPHGISHFLGLDVHDTGSRYSTLTEGMLLTCEPGIYIREEALGIRFENNILITATGHTDLMDGFPSEAQEIEELMHAAQTGPASHFQQSGKD